MKKLLILLGLINLMVLSGCSSSETVNDDKEDKIIYSLDLNLQFQEYSWVEFDGGTEYTPGIEQTVRGAFSFDSIEMLISPYGVFPYESVIVTESTDSLMTIILGICTELENEQSIGGALPSTSLKAKLLVELSENDTRVTLEFFQDENGEIVSMRVSYIDNATLIEGDFSEEYSSYFSQVESFLNGLKIE